MFTEKELKQFAGKGITEETINNQLGHFKRGFAYISLIRPATPGDGIFVFGEEEKVRYLDYFNGHIAGSSVTKFVPASGAASRMFKHLFEFRAWFDGSDEHKATYLADTGFNSVHYFIGHLSRIAFYPTLVRVLDQRGLCLTSLISDWKLGRLIGMILDEEGLNYAALPKGLLEFHHYPEGARTSAEEHLMEAADYARNRDGHSRIHFTISPEHQEAFRELFSRVKKPLENRLNTVFDISFSQQSPATDTLAVDEQNNPVRLDDGTILFRPGGHGALLKNLQQLDEEIIFIKNIDNVVPDRLKEQTFTNKRLIGGYLLFIRDRIFRFLKTAGEGQVSASQLNDIIRFMERFLFVSFPDAYLEKSPEEIQADLIQRLHRPIRVCGMVRNEGEPGGGPFWVRKKNGGESLQIVESSQIDPADPAQQETVHKATHFNPVDLVCAIRDFRGQKFDLSQYVDPETGFIAVKSSGGKTLKAQELPGLWNGAMASWITVFVEVPIITFNPVKTVNDLLRPEHLDEND